MTKKTNKPRSLRASAFNESQYPSDTVGLRCIEIKIPDDDKFVHQLAGVIALCTKRYNYSNVNPAKVADIAELWLNAYIETDWEGCMNCEDVQDCIENHEGTKSAIRNTINNYLNDIDNPPAGVPQTASKSASNLAENLNPSCNHDVLWAQCKQLVATTNDYIEDLLDKFEGLSNSVELAEAALSVVPIFGDNAAAIPKYINLVQEFISENYTADYTTTPIVGYEDTLACEIFCACFEDCEITVNRIFDILLARVVARYDTEIPVLSVLNDLASYLIGIDVGGDIVADMAFLLFWGGLKLANFIVGGLLRQPAIGDGVLKVWLELAVNDANDDWLLACEDCNNETVLTFLAVPLDSHLSLDTDGGIFNVGARWVYTPFHMTVTLDNEVTISGVTIRMAEASEFDNEININGNNYELVRGTFYGGTTYDYSIVVPNEFSDTIVFTFPDDVAFSYVFVSYIGA